VFRSEWTPYEHQVLANVGGVEVPVPVNIATVNTLFGAEISSPAEMDAWLDAADVGQNLVLVRCPLTAEHARRAVRSCGGNAPTSIRIASGPEALDVLPHVLHFCVKDVCAVLVHTYPCLAIDVIIAVSPDVIAFLEDQDAVSACSEALCKHRA
jgi:hypothetical protein